MEVFEKVVWIAEEPADGAQAGKHGSGLSDPDKQGKCTILSSSSNVPVLYHNFYLEF